MSQEQKITFIFGIFDFDESGVLTVDETILALRSTLSGLCKLSGLELPPETEIERVAVGAFAGVRDIEGSTISKIDFATYCTITPEITSWIDFYGDICETAKPAAPLGDRAVDRFIEALAAPPVRDMGHLLAKDMESGPTMLLELEDAAAAAQADGVPPVEVTRPQPPWLATTAFLEPTDCPAEVAALPAEGLQLEHLFGFNAQRRQHAFYAARGELVYPAGTVGVVLDCASGTQRHAQHHADCVECLRVHHAEGDTWVATGELGARPKVFCMVRHNARRSGNNPRGAPCWCAPRRIFGRRCLVGDSRRATRGRCRSSRCAACGYIRLARNASTVCRRCSSSHTCS